MLCAAFQGLGASGDKTSQQTVGLDLVLLAGRFNNRCTDNGSRPKRPGERFQSARHIDRVAQNRKFHAPLGADIADHHRAARRRPAISSASKARRAR